MEEWAIHVVVIECSSICRLTDECTSLQLSSKGSFSVRELEPDLTKKAEVAVHAKFVLQVEYLDACV